MVHPRKVVRQESGDGGCSDWVYGDYWHGPARLSLLDLEKKRIVNTIEIRGMYEGSQEPDHSFPIPFLVPRGSYFVPRVNQNKEGTPKILNLRDLTGEGVAGQFVLFEYEACSISLTTVLGYSGKSDRAVQYGVEMINEDGKPGSSPGLNKSSEKSPCDLAVGASTGNPDMERRAQSMKRSHSIRRSRSLYDNEMLPQDAAPDER